MRKRMAGRRLSTLLAPLPKTATTTEMTENKLTLSQFSDGCSFFRTQGSQKSRACMSLTSEIFSISVVSPLEDTCPNAADVIRCRRTCVSESKRTTICENGGSQTRIRPDLLFVTVRYCLIRRFRFFGSRLLLLLLFPLLLLVQLLLLLRFFLRMLAFQLLLALLLDAAERGAHLVCHTGQTV